MGARWARRVAATLAVAVVATGMTGCERQVAGPSLVLRLASGDKDTDETADAIRHFADEVDRRSQGAMRIDVTWRVNEGQKKYDQLTAGQVADGTYELAMVPARAFDDLGVNSLRALNTPFLITSNHALDRVLSGGLRAELLAELPQAGVVGLDIWPEALRHPFGFGSALVGLGDYHHALIQAPYSRTASMLFHELGADVAEFSPPDERGGVESQFSIAPGGVEFATGNVTFFPRTEVVVADEDVRARLRDDQWDVLVEAAADTRVWKSGQQDSDVEAAAGFCDRGGKIVGASDGQLAELHDAATAVTDWLRGDPATSKLIDEISDVVKDAPVEDPITQCSSDAEDLTAALDGVYRARVPKAVLLRAGAGQSQAQENSGVYTWTLDHGTATFHTEPLGYLNNPDGTMPYSYNGTTLVLRWDEDLDDFSTLTVRVARNGDLHFTDVRENLAYNQALGEGFYSIPWRRIGDLPG